MRFLKKHGNKYLFSKKVGDVFPVWGTCLGFEMLGAISTGGEPYLARCDSNDQGLALELLDGSSGSKLLGEVKTSS